MKRTLIALLIATVSMPVFAVSCRDFNSQAEAQRYHNSHGGRTHLDRDGDGEACECLPGGSHYGDSVCRR